MKNIHSSKERCTFNSTRFQCANGFWERIDAKTQRWSCSKTEDGRCTFVNCPMIKSRQS